MYIMIVYFILYIATYNVYNDNVFHIIYSYILCMQ